ncbi:MAG TPA: VCBS repeat-containing protein [Terriglobia bacterium]|nr:VCBS repeat-containing protein [Terriglobia bacterium]
MHRRKFLSLGLTAAAAPALTAAPAPRSAPAAAAPSGTTTTPVSQRPDVFLSHRIGTDHAEAISVMDMNGDGKPDIVSGAYWYENPGPLGTVWKRHQWRYVSVWPFRIAGESKTEFVAECAQFPVDVNHDGTLDVVTAAWQTDGVWWFENPKKPDTFWEQHLICHSTATEGMVHADINGDGVADIAVAHYRPSNLIWINFAGPKPVVHEVGGKTADGHGVGVADINGDGKPDLLSVHGWLENVDADRDQWKWHPEWELGEAGFPILGYDVNADGKMDIIYGHGHSFGLYWLEQKFSQGRRTWERHVIDESFSEAHALKLADIDDDGELELITGKRYRGDPDPGLYEPLCIFYYKIDRKTATFTRFPISYNGTAEIGTQIIVTDIDEDGDKDILVAGKTGVHWFENLRVDKVPPKVREQELRLNVNWPFAGESGPDSPADHEE